MSELIAVLQDPETHGHGELLASNNSGKYFINGKKVVYKDSLAENDQVPHVSPETSAKGHSDKVFSEGIPIHRHNDDRYCGALTTVQGQSKVYAG